MCEHIRLPFLDDFHLDALQSLCVVFECAAGDDLSGEADEVLVAIPHVIEVDDVRMVESAEDARLHPYAPLVPLWQALHVYGVPSHLLARLRVVCEVDRFVGAGAQSLIEANVATVWRRLHLVEGGGVTRHHEEGCEGEEGEGRGGEGEGVQGGVKDSEAS